MFLFGDEDISRGHTIKRLVRIIFSARWRIRRRLRRPERRTAPALAASPHAGSRIRSSMQICTPGSGWHVITVSAFDTAAYTGEKVPEELLPLLVSPEWVEERKIRRGVNSPIDQYFVDHGAGLLAALRVWGKSRRKSQADIRTLIDLADAVMLEKLAEVLAHSHDPDDLHASVKLEAIALAPRPQLNATLDFARKGFNRADKGRGRRGPSITRGPVDVLHAVHTL